MTKFALGFLALALTTGSAFAQDYLNCGLKISDNDPDCPFLGSCPQEDLKVSKTQLFLEMNEGEKKEGKIGLKKVIVMDKKDKEKKDVKITIFADDDRVEKLKTEKNLNAVAYNAKGLDYTVSKYGSTLDINIKSPDYYLNITLTGDARYTGMLYTGRNAVFVTCERLNKEVYEEFKSKKEAIENHQKEKAQKSGATKQ